MIEGLQGIAMEEVAGECLCHRMPPDGVPWRQWIKHLAGVGLCPCNKKMYDVHVGRKGFMILLHGGFSGTAWAFWRPHARLAVVMRRLEMKRVTLEPRRAHLPSRTMKHGQA